MRLSHGLRCPTPGYLQKKLHFVTFSPLEVHVFSPSQVSTFPINTTFLIHNFLFRTGAVQEEGDFRSFRRSYIFFLSFFGYVFIFFVF